MAEVKSDSEMRFLLLSKDLDNRDALTIIYEYELVELLQNPFAHNVVMQIWTSPYNNSSPLPCISTVHRLTWNYNHCQFDQEARLRFYQHRDLDAIGCHPF